jgi:hypothetical protein
MQKNGQGNQRQDPLEDQGKALAFHSSRPLKKSIAKVAHGIHGPDEPKDQYHTLHFKGEGKKSGPREAKG